MLNYNKELNFSPRALDFNGSLLFLRVEVTKVFHTTWDITSSGEHISDMLAFCTLSKYALSSSYSHHCAAGHTNQMTVIDYWQSSFKTFNIGEMLGSAIE